jgi:cephalosporin hydroxylase
VDQIQLFQEECKERIHNNAEDDLFIQLSLTWILRAFQQKYMYNFSWCNRPIIQLPQDILAMQEIIWRVKPDIIIETGIAHGGSLIFYASMLELLGGRGQIIGIDIDIRKHNRDEIEKHPMFKRITMIEGSSTEKEIVEDVRRIAEGKKVLVCLDSNHTHEHVLRELELYTPLVSIGSYCVVFDTIIEDMPAGSFPDRPWDRGNNSKTAVHEFLKSNDNFKIDRDIENKLLITAAPDGYLKRIM